MSSSMDFNDEKVRVRYGVVNRTTDGGMVEITSASGKRFSVSVWFDADTVRIEWGNHELEVREPVIFQR